MTDSDLISLVHANMIECWTTLSSTEFVQVHSDGDAVFVETPMKDAFLNCVLEANFNPVGLEKRVDEICAWYKERGIPFCWWLGPQSSPESIEDILSAKKFQYFGEVVGMVMDSADLTDAQELSSNIHVEQVNNPDLLDQWIKPLKAAFAFSDDGSEIYKNIFKTCMSSGDDFAHFVAFIDETPVSSMTVNFGKEVAALYNSATIESARGKGICTQLSTRAVQEAVNRGYKQITLQASPMSESIYERVGFKGVSGYKVFLAT